MIVLGIDTATAATAVALAREGEALGEARDDPAEGAHPGHATRLLEMADSLLRGAGLEWADIDRVAVGVGPGRFTGLRVGVASARGIAHSLSVQLVAVSSLHALALPALAPRALAPRALAPPALAPPVLGAASGAHAGVLALIDARRGELFAGRFPREGAAAADAAVVVAPERLAELADGAGEGRAWLAVGDGALRYASAVERAGLELPPRESGLHVVRAGAICELGAAAPAAARPEQVTPDYVRRPDAELALGHGPGTAEGAATSG